MQVLKHLEPDCIHILPLGIGNAFTRRYFNSSFLVICGGRAHLIDAPAPLRHIFKSAGETAGLAGLDIDAVDSLLLTHLHGDHCNGVEELGFWRRFYSEERKPSLYMLPELMKPLWENRLRASMATEGDPEVSTLESYFELHAVAPGQPTDLGTPGLRVEVRYTIHFVPCIGFRLSYNGYSVGYSCDTAFDPGMIDFLKGCDLIIHEAGVGPGHTPLENLIGLPESVRTKMRLIHVPDEHDVALSPIPVLEQGKLLRIEHP